MDQAINIIYNESCLVGLKKLADESVDCIITSPPYWMLRDYGIEGQFGLEETPEEFIRIQVGVFRECKRILKNDGTLWCNIGDSYANKASNKTPDQVNGKTSTITGRESQLQSAKTGNKIVGDLKPKDLVGIPWMLAFALRSDGWYLRQDIIWAKPNPMPESVTDRCTKSHEYIFLLSKSEKYYYDADSIREQRQSDEDSNIFRGGAYVGGNIDNSTIGKRTVVGNKKIKVPGGWDTASGGHGTINREGRTSSEYQEVELKEGRNKRSVWIVAPQPFPQAHFATFPEKLITDMIKAGCRPGGIILDPYMGAGTTALVARKLNRNYIGFEINPEYIEIANKRLNDQLGMFK